MKPNILWITLDSVRADHTTLHGYHRNTTPELARIAADSDGVSFEHGIAHSTRTPVSIPSMLTGLYPSCHQMMGKEPGVIPEGMVTAPEVLAEQGYHTIGVSENVYAGKAKRIDERFDEFVKPDPHPSDILSYKSGIRLIKYMLNSREHGPGPKLLDRSEHTQRSFFTTEITKEKLRKSSGTGDPFFCYVHYNDPHHPYRPPLLYLDEYTDETSATPEEALSFAEEMGDNLYEYMSEGVPFTDEEWEMLYAMYDAVIRYVDDCVGDLFDFVRKNFEDTIVVITSDHGDLFGEKNLLGHHIVLHDALIHVPLVVHGLKDVQRCASQPTQHIDVMQTLLSVTGADVSQFQGYNLMEECREIAVSQDHRGTVDDDEAQNYERIRQYNPDVDLSYLPKSRVASFRTTEFKLVQTDEWERLYRLPDESEDVTEKHPSVYEELSSFAHEWWENEGKPFDVEPSKKELEEETKQQLRDMGYLE